MILIWLMLWIVIGLDLVLSVRGWRGRRVNDHPYCVRCKYDLYGLAEDSAACPECGADIRKAKAVRVGLRRRRWRVLIPGVVCLLLTSSIAWWVVENPVVVRRYLPGSMLKLDLRLGTEALASQAFFEIVRRIGYVYNEDEIFDCVEWLIEEYPPGEYREKGSRVREVWDEALPAICYSVTDRLSIEAISKPVPKPLIDLILDIQAGSSQWWYGKYGDLIDSLGAADRIDVSRWDRYLANAARANLLVRDKIELGDPIVIAVELKPVIGWNSPYDAGFEIVAVRVDGLSLTDLSALKHSLGYMHDRDPGFRDRFRAHRDLPLIHQDRFIPWRAQQTFSLEVGQHKIEVDIVVRLWTDTHKKELLHEKMVTCVGNINVVSENEPSVQLHDASELQHSPDEYHFSVSLAPARLPKAGLEAYILAGLDGHLLGWAMTRPPDGINRFEAPTLAADAWIQIADHPPKYLGGILFPSTIGLAQFPYTGPPPSPGDRIRFIFKPNIDLAKRTVHIHDIWGEEIVIEQTYEAEEE